MLYNSFSNITKKALKLFDTAGDRYLAHISDSKRDETLKEHSELVLKYLGKIAVNQNIETIADNAIKVLCEAASINSTEVSNYCKAIFFNSVVLHDLGKINPNFQVEKMQNKDFQKQALEQKHYHSFLGSYIFSNYYFEQILEDDSVNENDKTFLYFIVIAFGCSINSHHSPFIGFEKEFNIKIVEESYQFLDVYKILLNSDCSISFYESFDDIINEFTAKADTKTYFSLFALLKLSYSLLTACDYYATNDYMADMQVDDFGVLNNELKEKITTNFYSTKSYNKELFERFEEFQNKPFTELQERNRANLNFLRQKLNAEVISSLKQNSDSHWYYIEAPTGAGKTNLSLACITELLKTDKSLNKIFYVFPFTTLITQTFQAIQETIGLTNNEIIQLHSKAGFHESNRTCAEVDATYGKEKRLYLDNLFVNYPFCVTSHVRFFEILKGNSKESNYLLHRLCNSVVVIDELQTYNPKHWDKILYFIEHYAPLFNIRFIIMSATLPKIDALSETAKGTFVSLTPNKHHYFTNKNFAGRIEFDFSLLDNADFKNIDKPNYISMLATFVKEQADVYFEKHGKARVLVEFITKNTASQFFKLVENEKKFEGYKLFIISGDILEPQRKTIINELKAVKYDKVLVVSTQVVEAGVDIDMDLGFKDRSLLDSDEQLAGRINRNASKDDCKVFLFDCDSAKVIYGKDKRYIQQQKDKDLFNNFREILQNKTFDKLYEKVFQEALKPDWTDGDKLDSYLDNFKQFDFKNISNEFRLIDEYESEQLFIPLDVELEKEDKLEYLEKINVLNIDKKLSGEMLFDRYISIIKNKHSDYTLNQIELKILTGLMSRFTISVYPKMIKALSCQFDAEKSQYGYKYFSHWKGKYDQVAGFDMKSVTEDVFL
ncbi:CRISPR-associated helicase/endonuclease Cas3 [Alkaliflexus imshenetskii]|uniref:CRISPR-associated helicase/endonuclease Cas3 n=1 Tax=Alkaliflexus imshenetskii TaxID=286730 RepID=UPI0004795CDA|nr:CRISPR-associated helicase/endonuclease Cas3 [Alkaliflexus imshenetskii]